MAACEDGACAADGWLKSSAEDSDDDEDDVEDKQMFGFVEDAVDRSSRDDLRVFSFFTIRLGAAVAAVFAASAFF